MFHDTAYFKRQYGHKTVELTPAEKAREVLRLNGFKAHKLPLFCSTLATALGGSQRGSARLFRDVANLVDHLELDQYILKVVIHQEHWEGYRKKLTIGLYVGKVLNDVEYLQPHMFYLDVDVQRLQVDTVTQAIRDYFYDRDAYQYETRIDYNNGPKRYRTAIMTGTHFCFTLHYLENTVRV